MPRQANAVDFWRGFALVSIFVNHIPGVWYERLTHRNLSISDSAELFVFLAGWSLGLLVGSRKEQMTAARLVVRLGGRALQIYAAQILIGSMALAMLAGAAYAFDNPLLLDWHNAAVVFQDPAHAQIGLVLLTHQLGYFDILPLYVVLMLAAPAIALIDRFARPLLLPMSLALYFAVPYRAVHGADLAGAGPMVLQSVHLAGDLRAGVCAVARRGSGGFRAPPHPHHPAWSRCRSCSSRRVVVWFNLMPDPTKLPEPKLLFLNGKSFLTPMRLIQFLALAAVFSAILSTVCAVGALAHGVPVEPGPQLA